MAKNNTLDSREFLKPLEREQERAYLLAYQKVGGESKKKLAELIVRSNLLFLAKVSYSYARKNDIPVEDLFSAGKLAMFKAVECFDTAHDVKFISFASFYIRNAFTELSQQRNLIAHKKTPDFFSKLPEYWNPTKFQYLSLDAPLADDTNDTYLDTLPSDEPLIEEDVARTLLIESMQGLIKDLDTRAQKILTGLYGLDGTSPKTYVEIARDMNYSRETVRKIESNSLMLLRNYLTKLDKDIGKN